MISRCKINEMIEYK